MKEPTRLVQKILIFICESRRCKGVKRSIDKINGVKVIVKKKREIYYINNVKFHIDEVPGLGSFVEIEAGNILADLTQEQLKEQCDFYLKEFMIKPEDLIEVSYSDMLLEKAEIKLTNVLQRS